MSWRIEVTYRELIEQLEKLTEEQLDCTVTVHHLHHEEYHGADFDIVVESDVLDEDHPILTID